MKRALSIAVALAVALSMLIVVPVGAVTDGTIQVDFFPPCSNLAGGLTEYRISFHNDGLLLAGNHIDIMFPDGTVLPDPIVDLEVWKGASRAVALGTVAATPPTAVDVSVNRVTDKTVRLTLEGAAFVDKCEWVAVFIPNVTNPKSCNYHLQVGTSVAGPFTSPDYTIYTTKIELFEGKNLISLPAYPEDPAIEVVLAALFAKAAADPTFEFSVWYWDSWAQEWIIYASDTSFSDLTELHAGKAYFVKVSDDITFKFKGTPYQECQGPPKKWEYPPSWSMIGIATTQPTMASVYLYDTMLPWPAQNTYAVSTIFGFNPAVQQFYNTGWRPGQRDQLPWDAPYQDIELEPGKGYFMSFLGEAYIIPPVP